MLGKALMLSASNGNTNDLAQAETVLKIAVGLRPTAPSNKLLLGMVYGAEVAISRRSIF